MAGYIKENSMRELYLLQCYIHQDFQSPYHSAIVACRFWVLSLILLESVKNPIFIHSEDGISLRPYVSVSHAFQRWQPTKKKNAEIDQIPIYKENIIHINWMILNDKPYFIINARQIPEQKNAYISRILHSLIFICALWLACGRHCSDQ